MVNVKLSYSYEELKSYDIKNKAIDEITEKTDMWKNWAEYDMVMSYPAYIQKNIESGNLHIEDKNGVPLSMIYHEIGGIWFSVNDKEEERDELEI